MTQVSKKNIDPPPVDVEERLTSLETFIARRFDEISMEIEATSQLMEMAEEDAGKRFTDMLAMLNAISFAGDGSSPANSGRELEAVVQETERAATNIMDAADSIKKTLEKYEDHFMDDMNLAAMADTIFNEINNITMACEFQDLVSQRVRTALTSIRDVQKRMDATLSKFGIDTHAAKDTIVADATGGDSASQIVSQDDIDALFD